MLPQPPEEYKIFEYAKEVGKKMGVPVEVGNVISKKGGVVYFNPFVVIEISQKTGVDPYTITYHFVCHEHMHNILHEKLDRDHWKKVRLLEVWLTLLERGIFGVPWNIIGKLSGAIGSLVEDYYIDTVLYKEVVDDPEKYEKGGEAIDRSILLVASDRLSVYMLIPRPTVIDRIWLVIGVGSLSLTALTYKESPEVVEVLEKYGLREVYDRIKKIIARVEDVDDIPNVYHDLVYEIVDTALALHSKWLSFQFSFN